jgi:ABC-2 type transport system ATP-binding protein
VRLGTRNMDGPWRDALPADAVHRDGVWRFVLPDTGVEPLLKALIARDAGIETLSIERPGLHDAFVAIAGEAVVREMDQPEPETLQ